MWQDPNSKMLRSVEFLSGWPKGLILQGDSLPISTHFLLAFSLHWFIQPLYLHSRETRAVPTTFKNLVSLRKGLFGQFSIFCFLPEVYVRQEWRWGGHRSSMWLVRSPKYQGESLIKPHLANHCQALTESLLLFQFHWPLCVFSNLVLITTLRCEF